MSKRVWLTIGTAGSVLIFPAVAHTGAARSASRPGTGQPAAPRSGSRSSPAQGGTTFDPNTGTLTVNVDLIGGEDASGNEIKFTNPDDGKVETAKQAWEQKVNDLWNGLLKNGGFKKFLFHATCANGKKAPGYRFQLKFVVNPLPPGAAGAPDHHHITFVNQRPTAGTSFVTDYTNVHTKGPNSDFSSPYTEDETGKWGIDNAQVIAHEVGHLMGLGDDDVRKNGGTDHAFDHRSTDTVMYGGRRRNKVNQNLVDRIAEQIQKNYKIPMDCGDYRYDVLIVTSVRNHYTIGPDSNGQIYTADTTFTWKGVFRDFPIKVKRRNGKFIYYITDRSPTSFSGVLQPVQLVFSASESGPYVNGSCSGLLNTLPGYPVPLLFDGSYTRVGGLLTSLDLNEWSGLENLIVAQEQAFGCVNGVAPPDAPFFPDDPEVRDPEGFVWTIPSASSDMGADFAGEGSASKLPKPIARLIEGKSFSFYSGHFSNTVTTDMGAAGIERLDESYLANVSFTRNR
jgi:hypothetical protein